MIYNKKNIIVLTYGMVFYQFLVDSSPSIFVFLIALLFELLFLLILFSFNSAFSKKKAFPSSMNVLIASLPFFIFTFIVLFAATEEIDHIEAFGTGNFHDLLLPFKIYKTQLIFIAIGILIAYFLDLYYLRSFKIERPLLIGIIIKQSLKIWALFSLTFIIFTMIPKDYYDYVLFSLPISRILFEVFLMKDQTLKKTLASSSISIDKEKT